MFYPGSLWIKRLTRLFILYTIGVNLFINDLQNTLLQVGEEMITVSTALSDPAVNTAYVMEHSIVPALAYFETTRLSSIMKDYGVPDSQDLKDRIQMAYRQKDVLEQYAPVYKNLSLILKIISLFFWIPIALSALWIFIDIKKSTARYFDVLALMGAICFNFVSYQYLTEYFLP